MGFAQLDDVVWRQHLLQNQLGTSFLSFYFHILRRTPAAARKISLLVFLFLDIKTMLLVG